MKSFLIGFTLSLCLILLFISSYWIYQAKMFSFSSRAYSNAVSAENSYCFTSPICQSAQDGLSQRISSFCLNSKGMGVRGQVGKMVVPPNLLVAIVQGVSDSDGQIIFDVTSKAPQTVNTDMYCGSVKIHCQAQICFK